MRTIRMQTFAVVLASALIPLFLFFIILFFENRSMVRSQSVTSMNILRDQKINSLQTQFSQLLNSLRLEGRPFLENIQSGRINSQQTQEALNILRSEHIPALEDVIFLNNAQQTLYIDHPDTDLDHQILIDSLKTLNFENNLLTINRELSSSRPNIVIYQRFIDSGRPAAYIIWIVNYSFIQRLLEDSPDRFNIDVYNDNYRLIASNHDSQLYEYRTDDLLQRMVDGYTQTLIYKDDLNTFSFMNFDKLELYIRVSEKMSLVEAPMNIFIFTFLFFFLIVFVASFFLARYFSHRVFHYAELVFIEENFSSELYLLKRLKHTISSLLRDIRLFSSFKIELDYLKHDVDFILKTLPSTKNRDETHLTQEGLDISSELSKKIDEIDEKLSSRSSDS